MHTIFFTENRFYSAISVPPLCPQNFNINKDNDMDVEETEVDEANLQGVYYNIYLIFMIIICFIILY